MEGTMRHRFGIIKEKQQQQQQNGTIQKGYKESAVHYVSELTIRQTRERRLFFHKENV
jgi:hypothetical protein